jgi:hypothetical protein
MSSAVEIVGTPTILMVGPTGTGKSSFGNRFLHRECFGVSDEPTSQTAQTTMEQTQIQSGSKEAFIHRAIDTPGHGDSEGRDWEFMGSTIQFLRSIEPGVNLIALVVQEGTRAATDFQTTFKMLHVAFGNCAEFWDHACLVITKCYWNRRRSWETKAQKQAQGWREKMRQIGQYCTDDHEWNYDIPVFFIDNDPELIPEAKDEQALHEDPAVNEWMQRSKQLSDFSLFRGWQNVAVQDNRLHSIFDFLLFEEWARSRSVLSTKNLQIPNQLFFQEKPVTEQFPVTERVAKYENRDITEEFYKTEDQMVEITEFQQVQEWKTVNVMEDHCVNETEMEDKVVKKTIPKEETYYVSEQKSKVERRAQQRKVWRSGGCFSHGHWETVTDYVNVNIPSTVQVKKTRSGQVEGSEVARTPKTVRRNHPRPVQKQVPVTGTPPVTKTVLRQVPVKCQKTRTGTFLAGFRILTFNVIRKGRRIRDWKVGAAWSEPQWDESQTTKTLVKEDFEPHSA